MKASADLLRRLEAATSRLEDIASSSQSDGTTRSTHASSVPITGAASVNGEGARASALSPAEELPPVIEEFDQLLQDDLKPFSDIGQKLGGLIADQVSFAIVSCTASNADTQGRPHTSTKPSKPKDKCFSLQTKRRNQSLAPRCTWKFSKT